MAKVLSLVVAVLGVWTVITGVYGFVDAGDNSTAELKEMQRWICSTLIVVGVGLVALAIPRLLPADRARSAA
jgi:hypothetical protein